MSRRFLISALGYLLFGLLLQAAHLADLWLGYNPISHTATNVVWHLLLVGWLTQAVVGLLYRVVIVSPRAAAAAWWCLNLGLIAAVVGQPWLVLTGSRAGGALLLVGGLLQVGGGVAVAIDLITAVRQGSGVRNLRS